MINLRRKFILKKSKGLVFIIIFLSMSIPSLVLALPPLPTEFYGLIRYYNSNASAGGLIRAYDSNGILCGSFVIVNSGFYGSLTCRGDDPETIIDEGATLGENITFRYNTGFTTIMGDNTFSYGAFKYINLTYPVVYCGDHFCDIWYENNYTCPQDCPSYNASGNGTINGTNIIGGGGAGEGGGGSRGDRQGRAYPGIIPSLYFNYSGLNISGLGLGFFCKEDWVCGNWSECRIDGFQNRTCIDLEKCGTYDNKPPEVQKCVYTPTCFDGVKNGLEEGIDCGGLCSPCITCFDGIQNCHDGLCENGIDCGGPCEKKCPAVQISLPQFVCEKNFNPFSNQSILFFIIIFLITLVDIIYSKNKIKGVGEKRDMNDIQRARKILSIRRRMYLFIFITLLISIILYLYYCFFIMCETEYKFLWLLLILLFVSPFIIHQVIKYLEYTEKKRLSKLVILLDTHYRQIENLIKIENENLIELEEELTNDLYRLLEKPEYKAKESPEEIKVLKDIYKELVFLYSKYKEKENPINREKILCDDIYKIIEEQRYKEIIQNDSRLKRIISKLKLLYKQYEEKQKLYDEMSKIENSKNDLKEELKE